MEALTLTRKEYTEALDLVNNQVGDEGYTTKFVITFPDGINTASVIEICRAIQNPSMENRIHLMKLCIAGKNVQVKCPNGEVEKFCLATVDDTFDAFPLFNKEPMALIAITDSLYGHILKKSVRLSKPKEAAAEHAE